VFYALEKARESERDFFRKTSGRVKAAKISLSLSFLTHQTYSLLCLILTPKNEPPLSTDVSSRRKNELRLMTKTSRTVEEKETNLHVGERGEREGEMESISN
jgi:hypothetical protein